MPFVLLALLLAAAPARAQLPTPEAPALRTYADDGDAFALGFDADLAGTRIGFAAICENGRVRARMHFGGFPPGKPVQAAIRDPQGRILRLGPVVLAGPRSGFHDPLVDDDGLARRAADAAFRNGALVSNGHNSLWNRVPEADNAAARRRILECR